MTRIRRAFLMSSLEQYLGLVVNLVMVAVLARLLTPAQIGVAVIGMGTSAIIFSLREFATPEFLIQRHAIGENDERTAFTVLLGLSIGLALAVLLASGPLSRFYAEPGLQHFLAITPMAALVEASALTSITRLRREMAFGVLARIRTAASICAALATVLLAWVGFGYMSYAWGLLAGAVTTAALVLASDRTRHSYRPSLTAWRDLFSFGSYRGATTVVEKVCETFPQMLLGYVMPMSAVGHFNRANAVSALPDRIFLSSIFAVAYPALAAQARGGSDLKKSYLRVLSYISVVYWPALVVLAVTADAVVKIILGDNWNEVVPVVRIMTLAALFWFPVTPTTPLLLAMGQNRDAFIVSLTGRSVGAVVLSLASFYGIIAIAWSQFIALPFQMMMTLLYARKHVGFTWRELAQTLWPSAAVTLLSLAGPLAVAFAASFHLSIPEFCLAGTLAAFGWAAGLLVTRHAFVAELVGPLGSASIALRRAAGTLTRLALAEGRQQN